MSKLTSPQETFFAYPRKCIHQDAVGLLKRWLKLKTQTVQRDVVIREISIWTNCVCCHITCSLKQPFADHYHHPGRWYAVGHFIVLVYWGIAQYTSRQDVWHGENDGRFRGNNHSKLFYWNDPEGPDQQDEASLMNSDAILLRKDKHGEPSQDTLFYMSVLGMLK